MPRTRRLPASADAVHALEAWFASRGWEPFAFQREVWAAYARGESGLIHAATGTGKTYAAWLAPVLEGLTELTDAARGRGTVRRTVRRRAEAAPLRVLWLTPLKALAADTELALQDAVEALRLPWTVESRTGDTSQARRARQRSQLPTALVTTPESLSLLLCRADAASLFRDLRCVIVDEWHELLSTKRGAQVELCLARLRALCPALRTWGLSATLGNLEQAAATLMGVDAQGVTRPHRLVRGLVPKTVEVEALVPDTMERFPWAGHLNTRLLPEVMRRLSQAGSAIMFTNTRSQCELWFQSLIAADPDWFAFTAIHHGSLSRRQREDVEDGLKTGRYRVVVATSSLDLGVDFSPVDLVLQVGSPKGVARLLQRAGRSGHAPGRPSRIVCVPTHAFELVEVAAARDAIAAGAIEAREPLDRPLDLLAQHLVTLALGGGFTREAVLAEVRTTHAYRLLTEAELDWVLAFVTHGGDTLRAYPEYAKVVVDEQGVHVVTDRRVALRHRLNIGTIVSDASIAVRTLRGRSLGTVEESFVARLSPGDRFMFAGQALEFVRLRDLTAFVKKVKGASGAIPRWAGARMPLSTELAAAVRAKLEEARTGTLTGPEMHAVREVLATQAERSVIPRPDELLVERTETRDGHHLFVYPFEGRLVHEGLAALCAYRIAQLAPITFTFTCNDYGFELLSPERAPLEEALEAGLFSTQHLLHDVTNSLNAAELARRQFREIARVAGLVFAGYPGQAKSLRQVQASTGLLFDVFMQYDPDNLLLAQARREVLERQLEVSRLGRVLARIATSDVRVVDVERPTPFGFPLMVDIARAKLSTESLAARVKRMTVAAERPARSGSASVFRIGDTVERLMTRPDAPRAVAAPDARRGRGRRAR
ncbi:MAG: ligase-associated DNA damage response DEXH box helicase [Gemmatimonadetes bacterium]|nr:ligase-associated DNA damage response DEXH box helicase [Gemmatimonadota bacterium]